MEPPDEREAEDGGGGSSAAPPRPKKRSKQGNHARLPHEVPLTALSRARYAALLRKPVLHPSIKAYVDAAMQLYRTQALDLPGSPLRWSLDVWQRWWDDRMRSPNVVISRECWTTPGLPRAKGRINNADEYYYVVAWAFANLSHPELVAEYLAKAGRNSCHSEDDEKRELAHRCHDDTCFRPTHLVMCSPKENTDMNGCKYGCEALCPHDAKPPYARCVFTRPVDIGATLAK
jgi:hypothetical protein